MHWRRKWHPTPVFLPGESQGRRSLVGCRPRGRTESDTTERLSEAHSRSRVGRAATLQPRSLLPKAPSASGKGATSACRPNVLTHLLVRGMLSDSICQMSHSLVLTKGKLECESEKYQHAQVKPP